jgi:8-oxo-dGTP diphosphatase
MAGEPVPKSEQGVSKDRYAVIPRVLIFVTRPGEVLLIKGNPNKRIWANKYNGIGGHVEYGEDILTAANRELREETGLSGIDLVLCGNIMVDASDSMGISIFVFKGEYRSGELIESQEGQIEWIPVDKVRQLPLVEDLIVMIPKVLAFRKGDAPLIGHTYYDENDRMVFQMG